MTMNDSVVRATVLAFYGAALASLFLPFPPLLEALLQYGTVLLFAAHAAEVVLCFRWVRMYPGSLVVSVLLTLLFGFVHWMPYKKRSQAGSQA